MSKSNRTYTKEFIQEAVRLAINSPSVTGAAKDLGIPEATLHTWVHKAKKTGDLPAPSGEVVNVGNLISENMQLKKRLARLEEEKSILKKAATYFAKELG